MKIIIPHSLSVGTAVTAGAVLTLKLTAVETVLLPPLVCKVPTGTVLRWLPPIDAVTFTVNVQKPGMSTLPPGIVRPVGKVTAEPPGIAVGTPAPPQVVATFGVPAITKPAGKLSVNGAVRVAAAKLVLVKVIVRVETSPALIVDGLKVLKSPTPPGAGTPAHAVASMVSLINVTAPFRAKALPLRVTPLFMLMLWSAIMFLRT